MENNQASNSPVSLWENETHEYNTMHPRLALILEEVLRLKPTIVLELGCGIGVFRDELLSLSSPCPEYYGTDISESAIRKLNHPNIVWADLNNKFPFEFKQFECVVCSGIVEYVSDTEMFLLEIAKRLVPGGILIMTYFNMKHIRRLYRKMMKRKLYQHTEWRNDYSYGELRKTIKNAGFEIQNEIPVTGGFGAAPGASEASMPTRRMRFVMKFFPDSLLHTKIFVARKT